MKKFSILGGKMERRNVKALHELAEEGYDLVINCSGLGARELVADKTVTPIRGQVYKVIDRPIYIAACLLPSSARIRVIAGKVTVAIANSLVRSDANVEFQI